MALCLQEYLKVLEYLRTFTLVFFMYIINSYYTNDLSCMWLKHIDRQLQRRFPIRVMTWIINICMVAEFLTHMWSYNKYVCLYFIFKYITNMWYLVSEQETIDDTLTLNNKFWFVFFFSSSSCQIWIYYIRLGASKFITVSRHSSWFHSKEQNVVRDLSPNIFFPFTLCHIFHHSFHYFSPCCAYTVRIRYRHKTYSSVPVSHVPSPQYAFRFYQFW